METHETQPARPNTIHSHLSSLWSKTKDVRKSFAISLLLALVFVTNLFWNLAYRINQRWNYFQIRSRNFREFLKGPQSKNFVLTSGTKFLVFSELFMVLGMMFFAISDKAHISLALFGLQKLTNLILTEFAKIIFGPKKGNRSEVLSKQYQEIKWSLKSLASLLGRVSHCAVLLTAMRRSDLFLSGFAERAMLIAVCTVLCIQEFTLLQSLLWHFLSEDRTREPSVGDRSRTNGTETTPLLSEDFVERISERAEEKEKERLRRMGLIHSTSRRPPFLSRSQLEEVESISQQIASHLYEGEERYYRTTFQRRLKELKSNANFTTECQLEYVMTGLGVCLLLGSTLVGASSSVTTLGMLSFFFSIVLVHLSHVHVQNIPTPPVTSSDIDSTLTSFVMGTESSDTISTLTALPSTPSLPPNLQPTVFDASTNRTHSSSNKEDETAKRVLNRNRQLQAQLINRFRREATNTHPLEAAKEEREEDLPPPAPPLPPSFSNNIHNNCNYNNRIQSRTDTNQTQYNFVPTSELSFQKSDLGQNRPPYGIAMTIGSFDTIHNGHDHLFNKMKSIGDIIVVGVYGDQLATILNNQVPSSNNQDTRLLQVQRFNPDHVFLVDSQNPAQQIRDHIRILQDKYGGKKMIFVRGDDMEQYPYEDVISEFMKTARIPYLYETHPIDVEKIVVPTDSPRGARRVFSS